LECKIIINEKCKRIINGVRDWNVKYIINEKIK
jgi:hypothetical protein